MIVGSIGPPQSVGTGAADLGGGQGHPTCHQQGKSHGGQQHYGASHKQSRLPCKWGGVSSVVRLWTHGVPLSVTCVAYFCERSGRITQMNRFLLAQKDYLCWGMLGRRTSENSVTHELEVRRIPLLRLYEKSSNSNEPPRHEANHRSVHERFSARTKSLVIFAHPPVVVDPSDHPLHHPPTR